MIRRRGRSREILIILFELIDRPLNAIRFFDEPLLFFSQRRDDLGMGGGRFAKRRCIGSHLLLPIFSKSRNLVFVDARDWAGGKIVCACGRM